jgi:hypothetical protein
MVPGVVFFAVDFLRFRGNSVRANRTNGRAVLAGVAIALCAAAMLTMNPLQAISAPGADKVPAHHEAPPTGTLPDTLPAANFTDGLNKNAYAMAAKIKPVLYEQPCYCMCDKTDGHESLLDCFVGMHASTCNLCRMEAIFAYEQTRKGTTPAQIRKAIIRGDWKKLNPQDYQIERDVN